MEQRSLEWHEAKWGLVSGSRLGDLMLASKKANETSLFYRIIEELTEPFDPTAIDDQYINKDMQRGIDMEPYGLEAIHQSTKEMAPMMDVGILVSEENQLLALSPDKISVDHKIAYEVKCPNGTTHAKWCYLGVLPHEHRAQALGYFAVNPDLEVLYWASYRPESRKKSLFKISLTRDSQINIGTERKPVMVSIDDAVDFLLAKYVELETALRDYGVLD